MAERRLVIVESPAKAKTIAGYLGDGYVVESSIGHIRDLPNRAADIPAAVKKEPWARLGVNVDDAFQPLYVVDPDKKKKVDELKRELKNSTELLLATDEDREGEAIAWHLLEVLNPKVPVRRMVFHEITKDAIQRALGETREIDADLVDAQETRRILDRLYGYEVSPVLWMKVAPRLSAGRVQSVATRLVVERERERMKFVAASYWDIVGTFDPGAFEAKLVAVEGKRVAQGRDFGDDGKLKGDLLALDEDAARTLAAALEGAPFSVRSVEEKPYRRSPAAPFMTSTLQQEASRKLRFSSQTTMRVAQRLYENGYITYMRTDSTTLSESALTAARAQAAQLYGADYVPSAPRRYERKVKNAQEAHEAIRPAGRLVPHAGRRGTRAVARRACAVRARVEAHRRVADGGRTRADGHAAPRRHRLRRPGRRVRRLGHRDHVPRLPGRVRGGPRRRCGVEERRRRAPPAAARGGGARRRDRAGAHRALDLSTCALHRGVAREGARGPGHRPPVDVRVDHGHDPRPWLRLQEGHGARADVPRVLGHEAAREALLPPRRLRVHGPARERPRRHRRGQGEPRRLAQPLLPRHRRRTARRRRRRASMRSSPITSRRSTRAT